MALDRYRAALRVSGVGRLLFTSLIARAPNGMSGLAILLLVTRHHGYGRAGLVAGLYVASAGVSNPLLSRLVDRTGARRVLIMTALGYVVAMSLLATVADRHYSLGLLVAAVAGATYPPVVSVVRGVWPRLLDDEVAPAVYGLEATAQEVIFIAGPATVALVAALLGASLTVAAAGVLCLVGTLSFAAAPQFSAHIRPTSRVRHRLLRSTRLPIYVGVGVALTVGFGMADVGVIAFVSGRHASAASGVVLAVWSLGSLLGGLLFGATGGRVDDGSVARGVAAIAASIAVAALAPGRVWLALILLVGGATVAPSLGRLYARVGAVAPDGAGTEAFAWVGVGLLVGSSVGSALGGLTVDALGPRAAFALAAVPPAVAGVALLGWLRREGSAELRREPLPS